MSAADTRDATMRLSGWLSVVLFVLGCGTTSTPPAETPAEPVSPRLIEGTDIEDTPEHRTILALVEKYRRGALASDPEQVLRITSPRYLDDSGTPDPGDDVDRAALERILRVDMPRVRVSRFDITDIRIVSEGDPIVVDLSYAAVSDMEGHVIEHRDETRLVIERSGNELLVVSGL